MADLCRTDIEALLPHRDAALFLLDATVRGSQVEGHASWPARHPHLAGHFPGLPIVPGVFLIEAAAQLAGVALAGRAGAASRLGMLAGVKRSLLHHPVRPGERVHFKLDVKPGIGDRIATASGYAQRDDGRKLLTVEITVALVDRSEITQ